MPLIDQIPTHHPLVGSHELLFRDWFSRLDKYDPIEIEVVDGQCFNFGSLFVVYEVVQVSAFVRVDPAYCLAERPIDRSISFCADFPRGRVRAIVKTLDNEPAAVLLGNRNPGLTYAARIYSAVHHCSVALRGPPAAHELDHVARHEAFQQLQGQVMRSGMKGHCDSLIGQLLWRINVGVRRHRHSARDNRRAPAQLAATDCGILRSAIITPFTGVENICRAAFYGLRMAGVRPHLVPVRDVNVGFSFSTMGDQFDVEPLFRKQTLVERDEPIQTVVHARSFHPNFRVSHDGPPEKKLWTVTFSFTLLRL